MPFQITESIEVFSEFSGAKISYHNGYKGTSSIAIIPSGLLSDTGVKQIELNFGKISEMPVLFRNESAFGFDVLSAVFYMLSRYEEYLSFQPDVHGRFPARCSAAVSHNFIQVPVADLWVEHLRLALLKEFPGIELLQSQFESILTYDIDQAFKYLGKAWLRSLGGIVKDLSTFSFSNVMDRLKVMVGNKKDPWDSYSDVMMCNKDSESKSIFFFPAGSRSNYDKNFQPDQPFVSKLIQFLKDSTEIGLHPSYYSSENPELFAVEKKKLEKATGSEIASSRQHFLKFKLPDTYRSLIECGITKDFSMTFPETPGFRAGTARPFYFYDLKNESATLLQLFPSCCMDSTFIHYCNTTPDAALEEMKYFLRTVFENKGVFIPIFHNHTFEDKKWMGVHEKIILEIRNRINKLEK